MLQIYPYLSLDVPAVVLAHRRRDTYIWITGRKQSPPQATVNQKSVNVHILPLRSDLLYKISLPRLRYTRAIVMSQSSTAKLRVSWHVPPVRAQKLGLKHATAWYHTSDPHFQGLLEKEKMSWLTIPSTGDGLNSA